MKEEFINLATRVITGEANIQEQEELRQQLLDSPELQQFYNELELSWTETAKLEETNFEHEDWESLNERIGNTNVKEGLSFSSKWAIAASVILVAALAFQFLLTGSMEKKYAYEADVEIVLPDNSTVILKKGGSIEYSSNFTEKRRVVLSGEAYFKVTKDAANPFTVNTGNTVTTVLGTGFLIKGNNKNRKVEIKVKEGKVSFGNDKAGPEILVAGDAAMFSDNKIDRTIPIKNNDFSIVSKELHFADAPINEVLEDVAHYYNISLDTTNLGKEVPKFSGTFKNKEANEVRQRIMEITGVTITVSDDTWTVKGGKR